VDPTVIILYHIEKAAIIVSDSVLFSKVQHTAIRLEILACASIDTLVKHKGKCVCKCHGLSPFGCGLNAQPVSQVPYTHIHIRMQVKNSVSVDFLS
jgi:hypothetical protein